MEILQHPPLAQDAPDAWGRFEELSGRSLRISLHEQLAQLWEAAQQVPQAERDAAWQQYVDELERMYTEDIGCHPRERHELEHRLEAAIAGGSRKTLGEILALFGSQPRNGPSSVAC